MPSALVTGATGILGREIVKALGDDKSTWPTVYALSRSQKLEWPENVKQQQLDLTASAEEMAKELGNVQPEIVFFAAYLAKDSEEEATKVNGAMLENFLQALKITGASEKVKRVVLTTGAKQVCQGPGNEMNSQPTQLHACTDPENSTVFTLAFPRILWKSLITGCPTLIDHQISTTSNRTSWPTRQKSKAGTGSSHTPTMSSALRKATS